MSSSPVRSLVPVWSSVMERQYIDGDHPRRNQSTAVSLVNVSVSGSAPCVDVIAIVGSREIKYSSDDTVAPVTVIDGGGNFPSDAIGTVAEA